MLKQAIILAGEDSTKLIAGNFASVDELPELIASKTDVVREAWGAV